MPIMLVLVYAVQLPLKIKIMNYNISTLYVQRKDLRLRKRLYNWTMMLAENYPIQESDVRQVLVLRGQMIENMCCSLFMKRIITHYVPQEKDIFKDQIEK
ncbi:hypothetical protein KSP39_PZI007137 [Platanthera zijinensis]|uniref:Uncharacterized protein n=1 Tax=Platanthera zijinensis TaxID=2320716 RepID=A0AAP0BP88_9ASPA